MEDDLTAQVYPVLIEGAPLDDLGRELVVNLFNEAEGEQLEDHGGGDAVRQKVVELCTDGEDALRCVVGEELVGNLLDEYLVVGRWDWCFRGDNLTVVLC